MWSGWRAKTPIWCDRAGNWFLTDTEQSEQRAEQERLAKEQVQAQLIQAARNLLTTGMEIEQVAQWLKRSNRLVESNQP